MSVWEFAAKYDDGLELAARCLLLNAALEAHADEKTRAETPGVALITTPSPTLGLRLVVLVDVDRVPGLAPGLNPTAAAFAPIRSRISGYLTQSPPWLSAVNGFGVREPKLQLASGDAIQGALQGTAGCALQWNAGHGFATAGHVAPTIGSAVTHAGAQVGTVAWANVLSAASPPADTDFAVIELASGGAFTTTVGAYRHAQPYDPVTVVLAGGAGVSDMIMGITPSWAVPSQSASIGDTYLTSAEFTQAGDSGAAATLSSGEIIGHVVGSSPGVTTLIQDLDHQLRHGRKHLPGLKA